MRPRRDTTAAVRRELATAAATLAQVERVAQEWRAAVDASRDAILVLAADDHILRVNRAAAALLGKPFLDIVGRLPAELFAPGLRRRLPGRTEMLDAPGRIEREVRLPGRDHWLAIACDPIRSATDGTYRGCVLVLQDISRRKTAEEAERRLGEERRRLAAHLETAREEERVGVAREIHDELGHALTAMKLDLAWLAHRFTPSAAEVNQRLAAMAGLLDQTIGAVRRVCTALRPGVLDDFGLLAALEWLTEQHARRTGVACRFVSAVGEPPLPPPAATAVFRIVQEALTNVARHAAARAVTVGVTRPTADTLVVRIEDDGRGFAARARRRRGGFGLIGMQERAASIGGAVTVRSRAGRGTKVELSLPVAAQKGARR